MKKCSKCKLEKPLSEFGGNIRTKDNKQSYCYECKKEYTKEYIAANQEKLKIKTQNYIRNNKEIIAERRKKYYEKNKEKIAIRTKKWQQANKEKRRLSSHNYRIRNPEKYKLTQLKSKNIVTLESRWRKLVNVAKKLNYQCLITLEQYIKITEKNSCHYCNDELPKKGYGLDRINNEPIYSVEKVVTCCGECNRIKGNSLSYEEMMFLSPVLIKIKESRNGNTK